MQAKSVLAPKITEHYFEYDNMKYFRENGHMVELCSYGEKKDPVGARAYLDVHAKIRADTVASHVKFVTSVEIDWQSTTSGEIGLNGFLPVFGLSGSAAVSTSFEKAKAAKLKLMCFQVSEAALLSMLNGPADGARKFLAEEGNDGRVCSAVWLWAEAELAEHFQTSTLVTASVSGGSSGLSIMGKGGTRGTETITVLAGSTCAYRLHKVKSWKDRSKTQVEELETDFKGNG